MTTSRMRRVDEALRAVIGSAIASELQDPRIGFVTVTSVETSPDLRHARLWVTVLGDEDERNETLKGLDAAHGRLQQMISRELRLKHTPELKVLYDDSVDRGMRVGELLEQEPSNSE